MGPTAAPDGILTLFDVLFQETYAVAVPETSSPNYNSGQRPDFKFELLPLHSPLLGQSLLVSFPPLIDMLKFSGYSYLIRGQRSGAGAPGSGGFTAGPRRSPVRVCKLLRRGGCGGTATGFGGRRALGRGRSPTPS